MRAKQILAKLQAIKEELRRVEHELQDVSPETTLERVVFIAARQAVQASESELHSAIFSLENLDGLTNDK